MRNLAGLFLLVALGCGSKSDRRPVVTFDAGPDSDTDTDTDTDTGTDTGTDTDTGTETDVGCQPDENEANDTVASATLVEDGASYRGLTLCVGDMDFFAVDLDVGQQLDFELLFRHRDTEDIDVELLDPTGREVLWYSNSGDDDELVSFWPWEELGGGRYVLRVYGWEDPRRGIEFAGNTYDLNVTVHDGVPCTPDAAEDDDTPAEAGDAPPAETGGSYGVCPGDPDHFAIDVDAGQRLVAYVSYFSPWGHVDLDILDVDGSTVLDEGFDYDPARTRQGRELARWDAEVDGTYTIRVRGADGVTNGYFLLPFVQRPPLCPVDDAFEENDYVGWAAELPPGRHDDLSVCFADDDWYAIDVVDGQSIGIDILFTHGADDEDIDVRLYDPSGERVEEGESGDDDERIDHDASETGEYLLHVYGWRGSENTYSIDLVVE